MRYIDYVRWSDVQVTFSDSVANSTVSVIVNVKESTTAILLMPVAQQRATATSQEGDK